MSRANDHRRLSSVSMNNGIDGLFSPKGASARIKNKL